MKPTLLALSLSACLASTAAMAQTDEERIRNLEDQVAQLTDLVNNMPPPPAASKVHLGGYGELNYKNLDDNGMDDIEIDLRRFVIFFGYDFNERMRFESEFEVEHVVAGVGARGAVEIEQAYLEFDLDSNKLLRTGVILMPIGIVNETHEPSTYYGVERPIVEQTVIPTTWWSGGAEFSQYLDNGISYGLMISEGLQTDDPGTDPNADPFNIKAGKQKTSFASANDLALTGRIKYTGLAGMELAMYAQYQPDLDQSAATSYVDSAVFLGGHAIYRFAGFKLTGLYAQWNLAGDAAKAAGKDKQFGGYAELSYRFMDSLGVFVRHSQWSLEKDVDQQQTVAGVNYWPDEDIVFKFDIQDQNEAAGNADGFHLGMGYQF